MGALAASRRPGRPARIDRDAIADAVLEIGLSHASMKAVAQHLGVSVPALYHHVKNQRELLLLAAERSLAFMHLPDDRGQHWSQWLREWARHSRTAFMEEPELLGLYLRGAVSTDRVVEVVDSVVRVLAEQGFSAAQALHAWEAAGALAVGSAVHALREDLALGAGRPSVAEWHRVLAQREPGEMAGARAALDAMPGDRDDEFEEALTTLLVGIAVRRGESPDAVLAGR